jgi:hypothetical protein
MPSLGTLPSSHIPQAALKRWFIARVDFVSHSEFVLCGYVYSHHRLRDGHPSMSSPLIELSADDSWARTLNTLYWLFDPAAQSVLDPSWDLRLPLLAMKCAGARLAELRAIEGGVAWPHPRSPATKHGHVRAS